MTIRERKLTFMERWPAHGVRAVLPTVVLRGFWGHLLELHFAWGTWRRIVQLDWREQP